MKAAADNDWGDNTQAKKETKIRMNKNILLTEKQEHWHDIACRIDCLVIFFLRTLL